MTTQKDFKRLVRGRMQKTGESYTAARARLLAARPASPATPALATLAGMSDEKVKAATGCTWEKWVFALDRVDAHAWSHRAIAEYVRTTYKVPSWWTQMVTVGYERIKGRRQIGQLADGGFAANKTRTYPVSVARLFKAFSDKRQRNRWLPGAGFTIKGQVKQRSMRIRWEDGTPLEAWFEAKGADKSSVSIQHRKLADKAAQVRVKAFWSERLNALGEILS